MSKPTVEAETKIRYEGNNGIVASWLLFRQPTRDKRGWSWQKGETSTCSFCSIISKFSAMNMKSARCWLVTTQPAAMTLSTVVDVARQHLSGNTSVLWNQPIVGTSNRLPWASILHQSSGFCTQSIAMCLQPVRRCTQTVGRAPRTLSATTHASVMPTLTCKQGPVTCLWPKLAKAKH